MKFKTVDYKWKYEEISHSLRIYSVILCNILTNFFSTNIILLAGAHANIRLSSLNC